MKRKITEKIDTVTCIPSEYWGEKIPAPRSVKIELCGRCNLRCKFCGLPGREKQPTVDMDFDKFKDWTRQMREAGVQEIGLFYLGESFMNVELLERAIRYLKGELAFPYVFITTNGTLATPQAVERCMDAGLDSLKWSVNSSDAEQFESVTGTKAKLFRRALANIAAAKEARDQGGYKCGLYASSIRYDGEQLVRMEKLLDEYVRPYVDEHYWLPLYGMAMRQEEMKAKFGYVPMHGNPGRIDVATGLPLRSGLPCWCVFTEGHVRVDGHMSACGFGADDKFDVGDLNTDSFMDIWNNALFRSVRAAHLRTETEGACALKGTMCEVCIVYEGERPKASAKLPNQPIKIFRKGASE